MTSGREATAHAPTCRWYEQAEDGTESCDCGSAGREATPTTPGMYAEQSAEGWAVWLVDEDGDWSEMPQRGEVLDASECTYYRLVEVTDD